MDLSDFVRLRPYAFHTTAAANHPRLLASQTVESARTMFARAGLADDPRLRMRRAEHTSVDVGVHRVLVRDQRPIAPGAIAFDDGWDLARFVEHLNGFAFFWPGARERPIKYGRNHFARYEAEGEELVVLRVATQDLFDANADRPPSFSRCNSGSARMQGGKRVPRGGTTFVSASEFPTPADVKELVFPGHATLPPSTEWSRSFDGPWTSLALGSNR